MNRALSVYLDLLRFMAAMVVFLQHAAAERVTGGVMPHFGYLGGDAVMAFFVLSGFVIAYTTDAKNAGLGDYAAARLARLYSVVVLALLLTILLDQIGLRAAPEIYNFKVYADDAPLLRLGAALLFSTELWFVSIRTFSNPAYWSVSYEFWYYVLFGAWFFLVGAKRWLAVGAVSLLIGPKILLLLPVWALGVVVYYVKDRIGWRTGLALFMGAPMAYAWFKWVDGRTLLSWRANLLVPDGIDLSWSIDFPGKYFVGLIIACSIAGFAAISPRVSFGRLGVPVRWLAGMTFSLYLFHMPLLHFFASVLPEQVAGSVWRAALVLFCTVVSVAVLAQFTERRKDVVRRLIESFRRRPKPA